MSDDVKQEGQSEVLIGEIERLQNMVDNLQQRVEQLDRLAHQDALVSLPNRRGFMRQLEQLIDRVRRYGSKAAMLFVDLDGLKMINDTFGHRAGDEALIRVAELLTHGVRRSDVVARIGGDEFAILLENAEAHSAEETANRLIDQIAGCEVDHDGDVLPLSVAIGVAMIEQDDDAETLMARADREMYRRKAVA